MGFYVNSLYCTPIKSLLLAFWISLSFMYYINKLQPQKKNRNQPLLSALLRPQPHPARLGSAWHLCSCDGHHMLAHHCWSIATLRCRLWILLNTVFSTATPISRSWHVKVILLFISVLPNGAAPGQMSFSKSIHLQQYFQSTQTRACLSSQASSAIDTSFVISPPAVWVAPPASPVSFTYLIFPGLAWQSGG